MRDDDRDAVARAWLEGWRATGIVLAEQPDYAGLRARVDRDLASGWQVAVAETAGVVVGFVALRPDEAKLDQIFVLPEAFGHGAGPLLFDHACRAMPAGFTLWTHGDNVRARAFYERRAPLRWEDGVHPKQGHAIRTYWFGGGDQ